MGISVISGKIGDIKHTVVNPASLNYFIALSLRSILTALSISFLNFSSKVLIDQQIVTFLIYFKISISRHTKSDLVLIITFALLCKISVNNVLVLLYISS